MVRWIDKINNPSEAILTRRDKMPETHYQQMEIQPWDVMEDLLTTEEFTGYLKGNMIKYGMRQGRKPGSDDAEKYKAYKAKLDDVMTYGQVGYEIKMCGEEE
jgi:hypothetical protein